MHVHTRIERVLGLLRCARRCKERCEARTFLRLPARAKCTLCSVSIWRKVSALLLTRKSASFAMDVVGVMLARRIMRFTWSRGATG